MPGSQQQGNKVDRKGSQALNYTSLKPAHTSSAHGPRARSSHVGPPRCKEGWHGERGKQVFRGTDCHLRHIERGHKITLDLRHGRHSLCLPPNTPPRFPRYTISSFAEPHAMWFQARRWQHHPVCPIKVFLTLRGKNLSSLTTPLQCNSDAPRR